MREVMHRSFRHAFLLLHERHDFAEVIHDGFKFGDRFAGLALEQALASVMKTHRAPLMRALEREGLAGD